MIDFTDYTTIPADVGSAVREFLDCLSEKNTMMRDEPPLYNSMVRCRLEDYIRPYRVPILYETLGSILDREDIICYHATKVLSPQKIRLAGLRINDWERYSSDIKEALNKWGVSSAKVDEALQRIKHEKTRKEHNGQDRLCYFVNLKNYSGEDGPGYDQFCQNIGGELARWPLQENMPDVYKVLRDSGDSVLVKFSIPFNWIADYERESVIAHFIYYEAATYLWNYSYDIEFDGTLFRDVPASSIIDVITVVPPKGYE